MAEQELEAVAQTAEEAAELAAQIPDITGYRKMIGAVLAAGGSTRFGSAKQLAQVGGASMIEKAAKTLSDAAINKACVVLGCEAEAIKIALQNSKQIVIVENAKWQEGLAGSIAKAVDFAKSRQASHLLLTVCDQPLVTTDLLDEMLDLSEEHPHSIIACRYGGSVGIPAIFPSAQFAELQKLNGDKGAKGIIQDSEDAVFIDFEDGVIDIDKPEDALVLKTL